MVVVVDVCNNIKAIRIFETQSNEYLGGVGLEDNGYLVLGGIFAQGPLR
jgi:hypothetical protein